MAKSLWRLSSMQSDEDVANAAAETGYDIVPAQLIRLPQHQGIRVRTVNRDCAKSRADNPDEWRARIEVLMDFAFHIAHAIVRRNDLNRQIRGPFPKLLRERPGRDAGGAD